MATGFGSFILDMMGAQNPKAKLIAQLLGSTGGTPAGAAPGTAPGVATPDATGAAPATGAPATPPQPEAYTSPNDLFSLYSQLTDRQTREHRIDSGLGLLASTIAQPGNRDLVYNAVTGGGSGGGGTDPSEMDPFSLVTSIQNKQAEIAAKERQLAALPAIAQQFGISMEQARQLFDADQLDDFIMQQQKPNMTTQTLADGTVAVIDQNAGGMRGGPMGPTKPNATQIIKDESTGNQFLIDSVTGQQIQVFDTGLPPPSGTDTRIVEDKATGRQWLIDNRTGDTVREFNTALEPTTDQQQYNIARAQGYPGTFEQWLTDDANRKKPVTNITTNVNSNENLIAQGLDKGLIERFGTNTQAVQTIQTVQQARRTMLSSGGIIAGNLLSPTLLEGRKILASAFGLPDQAATNTDTFTSSMKEIVLPRVKELGTGNSISNADREFVEKAVGANATVDQGAILRILDILEKGERNKIIKNNADMQARFDATKTPERPDGDPAFKASFQPTPVPEFSQEYLSHVNPADIETLKQAIKANPNGKAEAIADFDSIYGVGAASMFLGAQ